MLYDCGTNADADANGRNVLDVNFRLDSRDRSDPVSGRSHFSHGPKHFSKKVAVELKRIVSVSTAPLRCCFSRALV